jgi:hypothetical protein
MGKNRAYRRFSQLYKHENIMRDIIKSKYLKNGRKWRKKKPTYVSSAPGPATNASASNSNLRKKSIMRKKNQRNRAILGVFTAKFEKKETKKKATGSNAMRRCFSFFFFFSSSSGCFFFKTPPQIINYHPQPSIFRL